jgi:hypothetical protein
MSDISALEKLGAVGGPHHDKYVADVKKFEACTHPNVQSFTDYCLSCGFNTNYGPMAEDYLKEALKPEQEGASHTEEQVRSPVIRASEHTSPNAREEALESLTVAFKYCRLSHKLDREDWAELAEVAYRALLSTSSGE